jgi:hypothetical protein
MVTIGVDVEKVRDPPQTVNIAQSCFTPIEGPDVGVFTWYGAA